MPHAACLSAEFLAKVCDGAQQATFFSAEPLASGDDRDRVPLAVTSTAAAKPGAAACRQRKDDHSHNWSLHGQTETAPAHRGA